MTMSTTEGAFDRITVERVPQDRTGRPWHIEVHRPADDRHVATMEHMDLSTEELVALGDHIAHRLMFAE
jgi:hypothetical protein